LLDSSPSGSCGMEPLVAADGTMSYRVEFPEGKTINDFLGGSKFFESGSLQCLIGVVFTHFLCLSRSFFGVVRNSRCKLW
jgi:hypothetical protein